MDVLSVGAVLAAVAGGAGEALGSQVWAGVSEMVRRPFRRTGAGDDRVIPLSSGASEFEALRGSPADKQRALALAEVLVTRAEADVGFRDALQEWWKLAVQIQVGGNVTNTVSGGTQHGPVFQGQNFSGLTFGSAAQPQPAPCPQPDA